ncbi:unnamed protein product, partial [Chrysoparadoxa australica]
HLGSPPELGSESQKMLATNARIARGVGSRLRPAIRTLSSGELYTDKQKKTGRPLSPHVTTYAFPIGAISSITNRVTGVALAVGFSAVGVTSLVGGDVAGMMAAVGDSGVAPLAKGVVAFPFIYHYLGAVRHTVWDYMPETVNNEGLDSTSKMLMAGSGILTLAAMAV